MKALIICMALPLALTTALAQAQTRTTPKPGAKPVAKPVAKPAPKPAAQPAAKTAAKPPVGAAPAVATPAPRSTASGEKVRADDNNPFQEGSNVLNFGIGLGSYYGYYYSSFYPGLTASFMHGIKKIGPGVISAGGLVGFQSYGTDGADLYLGGRGAYHYNFKVPDLDLYAGVGVTVRIGSGSGIRGLAYPSSFAGARYYFSEKLGGFGEVGYDVNYLKVGLSVRL